MDELNFLAARLETLDASGIAALNAATQRKNGFENIGQIIDLTYNPDFFVHIPEVHNPRELGDYYLNKSGMVQTVSYTHLDVYKRQTMQSVGITTDNPQDFFIHGYSDREDRHIALPYDMVCACLLYTSRCV